MNKSASKWREAGKIQTLNSNFSLIMKTVTFQTTDVLLAIYITHIDLIWQLLFLIKIVWWKLTYIWRSATEMKLR